MAAACPGYDRLAGEFGPVRRQLGDHFIVVAELVVPPVCVVAAIAARRPAGASDGEIDLSTGRTELLGDLGPGLRASNYQHGSRQELLRVVVGVRVNLP